MSLRINTWLPPTEQKMYIDDQVYIISTLHQKAKDLEVKEMRVEELCLYNQYIGDMLIEEFVMHSKAILDCDLNYPIIFNRDGRLMDGRHRIAKAILEQQETIKFVRFKEYPTCDYISVNDK